MAKLRLQVDDLALPCRQMGLALHLGHDLPALLQRGDKGSAHGGQLVLRAALSRHARGREVGPRQMQAEPDPKDAALSLLLLRRFEGDLAACAAVIALLKHRDATVHEDFDRWGAVYGVI